MRFQQLLDESTSGGVLEECPGFQGWVMDPSRGNWTEICDESGTDLGSIHLH